MSNQETIKVTANQSARTFTIRVNQGNFKAKYRTIPMNQSDFNSEEMNTENDWKQFLKNTEDYYTV